MIKRTTIYLDEKTHEVAKTLAKKEGRSLSNFITCLIWGAKEKKIICPTCKQDMNDLPRKGFKNKDCPQCGQGLSRQIAKKEKIAIGETTKYIKSIF